VEKIFEKKLHDAIINLELLQKRGFIKYKVLAGDDEYGELEVVQVTRRTRATAKYPVGEVRDYAMPFIKGLQHDEIISIPFNKFAPESLRGNVCSWCTTNWGKGSYTTTINHEAGNVEIYRHAV
jgi:hypothetical protein